LKRAVFDTNILIRFAQDDPAIKAIFTTVPARIISIVTWSEFLVPFAQDADKDARRFLAETFEIMDTDHSLYELALDLRRQSGRKLKLPDALTERTLTPGRRMFISLMNRAH